MVTDIEVIYYEAMPKEYVEKIVGVTSKLFVLMPFFLENIATIYFFFRIY